MSNEVPSLPNVNEGEAWALRSVIQWLQDLDIDDIIIDTDCQQVVTSSLQKQQVD